jgi:hypothetical protein
MEYLTHDGQTLHKIYITQKFVDIDDVRLPVNTVSLFTENEGKLQTDEHIIRYTKGSLYLYDTRHNLLRVYLFSKKYTKEPSLDFYENTFTSQELNHILQDRFSLKPGVVLELYKTDTDTYYIKKVTVSSTGLNVTSTKVKSIYGVGESIVYLTEDNDKLQINKKYKCTYNGCPVGRYSNVLR